MNRTSDEVSVEALTLPALQDAVLNEAELSALFGDLELLGDVLDVRVKATARTHTTPERFTLEQGKSELVSGRADGLQIVYRYQGAGWIDTLIRRPEGFQLVRIQTVEPRQIG